MKSKGGRQVYKRELPPSFNAECSVLGQHTTEPSCAGGGADGLNTSYAAPEAAQHKRQHVGSAMSQDLGLPSSPWSNRPTLGRQGAAEQSTCRTSGESLPGIAVLQPVQLASVSKFT